MKIRIFEEIRSNIRLELTAIKFSTHTVTYDPRLKTTTRPDVCDALYQSVQNELYQDGYENIALNEDELKQLNSLIR